MRQAEEDTENKIARFGLTNQIVELILQAIAEGIDDGDKDDAADFERAMYRLCIVEVCEKQEALEERCSLLQEKIDILKKKLAILEGGA